MQSRLLLLVGIVAICPLCADVQTAAALPVADAPMQIKAASRALVEAQLRYDAPAVARLLAKDFVYVGSDGSLARKGEFLPTTQDRKRRSLQLLEWKLLQIGFYGDTAVALYFIHEKGIEKGQSHNFRGRSLATWVKQNGRWVCAAIHD